MALEDVRRRPKGETSSHSSQPFPLNSPDPSVLVRPVLGFPGQPCRNHSEPLADRANNNRGRADICFCSEQQPEGNSLPLHWVEALLMPT